jgi:hypothetical protein
MEKLFENEDFILSSTGHDYDFVGIIETKGDEPMTFFFTTDCIESDEVDEDYDDWDGSLIDENTTELIDVQYGLAQDEDNDEVQGECMRLGADSYLTTRDDKSTGFLSDPQERGQFLAIIKHYCPEQINRLTWVEDGKSFM